MNTSAVACGEEKITHDALMKLIEKLAGFVATAVLQIAASLSPKFERYLDLTAIYFSANAPASAVSSGSCGLKSRTSLLRRNRGKRE
jgi:hypothetical protein